MRKTINIITLFFFIWLLLDAFKIPDALLYFLLVGEIPGIGASLSPTIMLAVFASAAVIIVFEFLARRVELISRIRQHIVQFIRREHLTRA